MHCEKNYTEYFGVDCVYDSDNVCGAEMIVCVGVVEGKADVTDMADSVLDAEGTDEMNVTEEERYLKGKQQETLLGPPD